MSGNAEVMKDRSVDDILQERGTLCAAAQFRAAEGLAIDSTGKDESRLRALDAELRRRGVDPFGAPSSSKA